MVLDKSCLLPVGFERDEGLLPYPARSFLGYRLLSEFFAFPEKFLFIDVAGWGRGELAWLSDRLGGHSVALEREPQRPDRDAQGRWIRYVWLAFAWVEDDRLMARAWELAEELAKKPTLALRYTRLLLTEYLRRQMHDLLGYGLGMEMLALLEKPEAPPEKS